jgi:predicted HicB family RNase H-like nuclease
MGRETRLNVRIDEELYRQLRVETVRARISLSALIRDLVSEWVEQRLAEHARESRMRDEQTKQK